MQNNTDHSLASDQALYRDALEKRKKHDMPCPPFFFCDQGIILLFL